MGPFLCKVSLFHPAVAPDCKMHVPKSKTTNPSSDAVCRSPAPSWVPGVQEKVAAPSPVLSAVGTPAPSRGQSLPTLATPPGLSQHGTLSPCPPCVLVCKSICALTPLGQRRAGWEHPLRSRGQHPANLAEGMKEHPPTWGPAQDAGLASPGSSPLHSR